MWPTSVLVTLFPVLAQQSTSSMSADVLRIIDAGGTIGVLALLVVLGLRGDLRFNREIQVVLDQSERDRAAAERDREAAEERVAVLRAEADAWKAAYRDQCRAREAAERSALNAMEAAQVVEALVEAFREASGQGRG